MQTITSRAVQTNYGSFTEAVADDMGCLSRYGRPSYYAISARQSNPELFIARMLVTFGPANADTQADAGNRFAGFVKAPNLYSVVVSSSTWDELAIVLQRSKFDSCPPLAKRLLVLLPKLS